LATKSSHFCIIFARFSQFCLNQPSDSEVIK
jgi:hypothetical protein